MNTLSGSFIPNLNTDRARENVILLDDLEFAMTKDQLETITDMHNKGLTFPEISQEVKRNKYEVLLALLHQVKKGRLMRPFGRHVS